MNPSQPNQPNQPNQPEEVEIAVDRPSELRIPFTEGFYQLPTGEVRRAAVSDVRVLWFDATLECFITVELRSQANARRLLGELTYLPNFTR